LCDSLERVRDLAPDAVLIVVGDHTPAGALGRVERGMSGTAMAGLLPALAADGVGAAVVWGLVPTFRTGAALHVPHGVGISLLSAKADLIRAHLANVLRDHAELVATASTVLVTVSASFLVAMSAPRTHDRPERIPLRAPAVEPAPHPVVAVSPTTRTPAHGPSRNEGKPGDRQGPTRGESRDHGRQDHPPSVASRPPGVAYGWDHRPPKHADDGDHGGWTNNSVPEDLPPGSENAGGRRPRTTGPPVAFGIAPHGPPESGGPCPPPPDSA